jgi:lipid-A-disaccharide synthase
VKILLSAGEASGDLHGSHLIQQIKILRPGIEFLGLGGDLMQASGMRVLYHINQMSIIGLTEVFKNLSFLRSVFRHLREVLVREKPDLVILIDYPGFNLRLAKIAHELTIPVMYFIIPQIWAWGGRRIRKIARYVDRAAVILPFEEPLLKKAGVNVTYVGHPLIDSLKPQFSQNEFLQRHELTPPNKILGLLPGSRFSEVTRLLPEMLATARKLKAKIPELVVFVGKSANLDLRLYQQLLNGTTEWVRILEGETYDIMKHADALLVASGTATLEAALLGTPLILVYRTSALTYFVARKLIKIGFIGLPNIIAGQSIIPEFIQHQFTAARVVPVLETLLMNSVQNLAKRAALAQIREKLEGTGATKNAAKIALEMLTPKVDLV